MILYHAVSTYQLLNCIVHNEIKHKNDETHLILSSYIINKFPNYKELEGKFFSKVYVYNNSEFTVKSESGDLEKTIINKFDVYFENNKIDLSNYSSINVGCAHGVFGCYLVLKEKEFTFIEDASGLLSRSYIIEDIEKNISITQYELSKKLGLYDGQNKVITSYLCNMNTQEEGFICQKAKHFDVVYELSQLNQSFIDKVLQFFNIRKKFSTKYESYLLLTQHFANLKILTFEQQKYIYTLLYDYLLNDKDLVIKTHPDDIMYYEQMFPNSLVIREKFPSELIPFIFEEVPKGLVTVTSTAIKNLKTQFKYCYKHDQEFEKNYEVIHSYYSILKILGELNIEKKYYEINTSKSLLNNLIELSDININSRVEKINKLSTAESNSIIFVDDYCDDILNECSKVTDFIENIDDDSIVVFLNSNKHYLFFDTHKKDIFINMVPIQIIVKDMNCEGVSKEHSYTVYVYSKKSEVKKMITEVAVDKTLSKSQKTVSVKSNSIDDVEILVLKGILDATEKRLQYYIKLEKELREELQKKSN